MKDIEKQIEEMASDMDYACTKQDLYPSDAKEIAKVLYLLGYRKIPEDSIMLSREEYERLSSSHNIVFCDNKDCPDNLLCRCCEISECPKNIPEYNEKLSANKHKLELFQKLCKERERADSWEDKYKLLQEELKQERKETAEKILNEIYTVLWDEKIPIANSFISLDVKIREIATREGIEIKE